MKKYKPTGKTFEIDSFEKLCNVVTTENFQNLSMDLLKWLAVVAKQMETFRKKNPKLSKGKTNWDLCKLTFVWIDDGKNDMESLVLKNQDTGEVKHIQFKK
jgi:hypothetical protein